MKKTKLNMFEEKDTIDTIKKDLNKSSERIVTLRFALKGLMGELPSYIIDKLIEICGEISMEKQRVDFLSSMLKPGE